MSAMTRMKPCPMCGGAGELPEAFSDRLKLARDAKGMTQAQLAEIVGISRPQLANLETGRGDASVPVLIGLSGALLVSIDWLLTGKEPNHDPAHQ
jgi:repressor LexA